MNAHFKKFTACLQEGLIHEWKQALLAPPLPLTSLNNSRFCSTHNHCSAFLSTAAYYTNDILRILISSKTNLRGCKNFGLRICAKQWDLSYNELLSNFEVLTLNQRRLYLKLTTMYKIVYDLLVFPPVFVRRSTRAYVNSNTVKPPNKGHIGDGPFVPCREVVLFSEVLFKTY